MVIDTHLDGDGLDELVARERRREQSEGHVPDPVDSTARVGQR